MSIDEREFYIMTEIELNAIFNIVCDPEKNVYVLDSVKKIEEVRRIARIFNIALSQRATSKPIAARGLVAFKMLVSNN